MERITNLLNHIPMELTSNTCDKHGERKNPVFTMLVDGAEICPICERDRKNEELTRIETEKANHFLINQNYRMFETSSVLKDTSLLRASFGTYEALEDEEMKNKNRAITAFKKYKSGEVFNTLFAGTTGVGKSHLAVSILKNLNESNKKDKSCVFIDIDHMLRLLKNSFNNKESRYTESYFIDLCSEADFLVLDDLGAETGDIATDKKASNFTSRILRSISNARQEKCTIFTTNLSRTALESMYDKKAVSRMLKNTYLIKFESTTDKRKKGVEF